MGMKCGIGHITFTDGKARFLFRADRHAEPVLHEVEAPSFGEGLDGLLDFAGRENIPLTRAVAALDGRDCILRNFTLPVRNPRELERAVAFEFEDGLPLSPAEVVVDHFRGDVEGAVSHVAACAVRRDRLESLLESFSERGVMLMRVDVDAAAFARACGAGYPDAEFLAGLDIGRDRTLFCLLRKGRVRRLAVIPWGESELLDGFARESGVSADEAGRLLLLGPSGKGADEHAELLTRHQERFFLRLFREVGRHLDDTGMPSRLVVSGDIVRAQGFRTMLREELSAEVDVWEERCLAPGLELDEGVRGTGLAVAYGLAEERGGAINFRKGDYRLADAGEGPRGWLYPAAALAAVLLAWGVYAYASAVGDGRQLELYRSATRQLYAEALPDVSGDLEPVQYRSVVENRMAAMAADGAGETDESGSVIHLLLAVSRVVTQDVELSTMTLDGKRLNFQGEAATMGDVDAARTALEGAGLFRSVKIVNAVADRRSSRIRFEIVVER